jgi:CDP-diacylglycerol---glycerol-3-phosphate 3-phosphatidyltransferase
VLFTVASVTDFLDGYTARRLHMVSSTGVFFDLTADKIFVSATLIALVQIAVVPAWIVIIVLIREFLLTDLRFMAVAKGRVIPAGKWGKLKTFFTLTAIGGILLAKGLDIHQPDLLRSFLIFKNNTLQMNEFLFLIANILLLFAVLWTVISGAEYIISALPLFQSRSEATTPKV